MNQTAAPQPLTATAATLDHLAEAALSVTVWAGLKAARLLRLVPSGAEWFVGRAWRSGLAFWREDQDAPACRNFTAMLGRWEVVVSIPKK